MLRCGFGWVGAHMGTGQRPAELRRRYQRGDGAPFPKKPPQEPPNLEEGRLDGLLQRDGVGQRLLGLGELRGRRVWGRAGGVWEGARWRGEGRGVGGVWEELSGREPISPWRAGVVSI